MPAGGAAGPDELLALPDDLDGLTHLIEAGRLKNDRGQVMDGSGFSFTLTRLHNERPVIYRVRCNVETRTGNYVQFEFPRPDHADPATNTGDSVKAAFHGLVQAWDPTYASVSTFSFRRAQNVDRRAKEIPVGWLTYLSDDVEIDKSELPTAVRATEESGGILLELPGTPQELSLDDALGVRRALGYELG